MPTSRDAESADSAEEVTPLDGDDFLTANRRNRERIRAEQAAAGRGGADGAEPTAADADASDEEGSAVGETGERAGAGSTLGGANRLPTVLAAVLAVAVVVLAVLLARSGGDDEPTSGDTGAILDTAKSSAAQVLTYRSGAYDDLDRRIRQISTPEFADRYVTSSQAARKANDEAQASSTATAALAGIVSSGTDEAVVLVALDQRVTTPQAPSAGENGIEYQSRLKLTLVRDGDRWLVSDLETI